MEHRRRHVFLLLGPLALRSLPNLHHTCAPIILMNVPTPPALSTLSLHDALPIWHRPCAISLFTRPLVIHSSPKRPKKCMAGMHRCAPGTLIDSFPLASICRHGASSPSCISFTWSPRSSFFTKPPPHLRAYHSDERTHTPCPLHSLPTRRSSDLASSLCHLPLH